MDYGKKARTVTLPDSIQTTTDPHSAANDWPAVAILSLFAGLLLFCYFPMLLVTGKVLIFSDDMAYGFFAPLVALYIAWDARRFLLHPSTSPSVWSVPVLLFAAALATVSTLANSSTFSRLAFLISLAGCLLLIGGWATLRRFAFPLSLLLFTFPVPDVYYGEITQPLQLLASRLSESAFETLGLSVFREGNIIQLTYMKLSVVEACSGLRSLITLFFFCLIYSYFFEARMWLRAVLVFLAIPSAIAINALRITTTGVLGKYDMKWTSGTYHEIVGWVAFSIGFLLVLGFHQLARRFLASPSRRLPPAVPPVLATGVAR